MNIYCLGIYYCLVFIKVDYLSGFFKEERMGVLK